MSYTRLVQEHSHTMTHSDQPTRESAQAQAEQQPQLLQNTFLAVFKVHGDSVRLWPRHVAAAVAANSHTLSISCHNVDSHCEHAGSDIQVCALDAAGPLLDECRFGEQLASGQPLEGQQLISFVTGPVARARNTSYAFDLLLTGRAHYSQEEEEARDGAHSPLPAAGASSKLGTAYVYLDPSFTTQGVQRAPVVAAAGADHRPHVAIGQLQIEFLVVTNPVAYGQAPPRPHWFFGGGRALHAGHRGAGSCRRRDLPECLLENTIASFNYAHRNGADVCELDVLMSADGVPVVYHDFDFDAAVAPGNVADEPAKMRVQVSDLTMQQLRDFKLLPLHDVDGAAYTLNVAHQAPDNRPFPTLAEVLQQVDETCALNVEIKWPQMLESGRMEARKYREINDFVDRIIQVVQQHAAGRQIVLESFDADLVIMLRMKQNQFPVVFLSQAMTDKYELYADVRTRCVRTGVYFAQAFQLAGVDLILDYYLDSGRKLVEFMNAHGLEARAWGHLSDPLSQLPALEDLGLNCITYDKIDLIRKQLRDPFNTSPKQASCLAVANQENQNPNANMAFVGSGGGGGGASCGG